jgi:uncharacterized protein YkwD
MRIKAPLLVLAFLAMPGAAFGQAAPATDQPPPCRAEENFSRKAEALIADAINAARAEAMPGAPALRFDEQLTRIAERRACELAGTGKALSHLDDKGHLEAADIVFSVFSPYGLVGENLLRLRVPASGAPVAWNAEDVARTAAKLWLKSPAHRAHILNPRYDQSGIGVALVGGEVVAAQVFHGPPRRTAHAAAKAKGR